MQRTTLGRLTSRPIVDRSARDAYIPVGRAEVLAAFQGDFSGYAAVLCLGPESVLDTGETPVVFSPPNLEYLGPDDVVAIDLDGTVRVWYRRHSENNTILLTEQCNSLCLMCSQPPKPEDDSARIPLILRLLDLIHRDARILTLSGGEPTLLGSGFFDIVTRARDSLPNTGLHILSNGRRFKDPTLASRLKAIQHHDLVLGIPLYSDIDWRHDYVVQARGAYNETISGLLHLAQVGVRLELRVVLHRQTVERLPELARFIARNLPFVEHVALMGLEMYGFATQNVETLWIDPVDYRTKLSSAVRTLALSGMNVSVYNHQLCTLPRHLWPFTRKSISDWKTIYLPECEACSVREHCGGFFQSGTKRRSVAIKPVSALSPSLAKALHILSSEIELD